MSLKIDKNIPLPSKRTLANKYPDVFAVASKMQLHDSVLLKEYYKAACLQRLLKEKNFSAPLRVIRNKNKERLGWRVWAMEKPK